ncbi:TerC family protein [Mucilaginibacter sp. NFR10]|uniref:TerC family protein n=1 Tax=unclassified Mucilaginibacter TaxID=2617802 RepID=UPI000871A7CD|nr:TerC family protein [Mucilaginibacter sp. NFR10]SCW70407.1 integral membrane protein, YkoY family [Mucilaginibacter sp. NFR10]
MEFLHYLLGPDLKAGLLIVLNLIVIESLLSVDNAAVLATMVLDLPPHQRKKALRYGIIGAYVLRGVCLFLAAWLVSVWWLKPLGGLYLIYLSFNYFKGKLKKADGDAEEETVDKNKNWLYRSTVGLIGNLWATIALVELMDLAFSIDNVFAAVAFTDHKMLIYIGVFIGILAMRFVAQAFVRLMEKFTFLETVAFIVIGVLGIKLASSLFVHLYPEAGFSKLMEGESADIFTSVFTVALFIIPVLTSLLFNFPKRHTTEPKVAEAAEDVLDKQ